MIQVSPLDEARFLKLFIRHERALAGIARALLPDWEAVDDVLQESSVVMWRKIDQLNADEEFMAWGSVILRFEILRYRRKLSRDRLKLDDGLVGLLAEESNSASEESESRRQAVLACLQKLNVENRRLVLAPYTRDESVTEIAESIGKSVNSLYKRLGRLRAKLQSCVESQLGAQS